LQTTNRSSISTTNIVLVSTLMAGAIAAALTQSWFGAILLLAGSLFGLSAALYARRPNSRDTTRLNAIEYRDERDRVLAKQGFATVGAAALMLSVIEVVLAIVFFDQLVAIACAQLFALCIVWGIANSNAARRG
jgi:membrane associated rhomboid family serine protease